MSSGAHYTINQASNAVPSGTKDVARIDIRYGQPLHLIADSDVGQVNPVWTILAWPAGSARSQPTNRTTFDATYTPDVPGSYSAEIVVGDGSPGNVRRFVFRATQDANGLVVDDGVAEPAFGEVVGDDNAGGNDRGYAAAYEAALARTVPTIANVTNLRNRRAAKHKQVHLLGYTTSGDGGGGIFRWDATSTAADDGGTVFQPGFGTGGAMATGRWIRTYSGPVHLTWFGADPTGVVDAGTALTAACNASRHVLVPPGAYKLGGWTTPRSGITIDFADGGAFNISDSVVTNHTNVRWIGHALGHNFNSDGTSTWRPNIVCQTGMANKTAMRFANGASADGSFLHGMMVDGNGVSGVTAYRVGTAGFGASGYQWGVFTSLDCDYGLNIQAACEESAFHCPYLGWRAGSLGTGIIGIQEGADGSYDGGITSCTIGDWGGTISGFTKSYQGGGSIGRITTADIGGDNRLVMETIRTSGAVAAEIYDTFVTRVRGLHVEMHGMLIVGVTRGNPTTITTYLPHGITTGTTIKNSNILGTVTANGSFTATSTGANTYTIPINTTSDGAYAGGGLVTDMTHKGVVIGHSGTAAIGVSVRDSYIAGTQYPVELIGFDQLDVDNLDIEVSASGDATHLPYAIKNTGGGLRRQEGVIKGLRVQRGTWYGGDISDTTGIDSYDVMNRDVNNEIVPQRFFSGTLESPTLRDPRVTKDLILGLTYTITAVSNTTPIELTFSGSTKLRTNDVVRVLGTGLGAIDFHDFAVTRTASNKVTLQGSTATGTSSSGSVITESLFKILECVGFDITMNDGYNLVFRQSNGTPFLFQSKDAATAGTPTTIPVGFLTRGFVWNGAASISKDFGWVPVISQANPFKGYLDGQIAGTSRFAFDSDGQLWPAGHGVVREVWSSGAAPNTAAPDGGDWNVGDCWVRTDVSSGQPSRWRCTTAGHAGTVVWKVEATLA